MISELLPASVACAEAFEDGSDDVLFPQERSLVVGTVERRRLEFATVRACARRAMAELGVPAAPVLPGVRNVPQWPDGIVGSMTHCDGYRAAVLARTADIGAVGIDAEPDLPLPQGVLEAIALPSELAWVRRVGAPGGVSFDRLLFSAKECVYKTWFPLMRTELDFEDAEIDFTTEGTGTAGTGGTFRARVLRPGRGPRGQWVTGFSGGWLSRGGLLITAIALDAFSGPARP